MPLRKNNMPRPPFWAKRLPAKICTRLGKPVTIFLLFSTTAVGLCARPHFSYMTPLGSVAGEGHGTPLIIKCEPTLLSFKPQSLLGFLHMRFLLPRCLLEKAQVAKLLQ